MTHSFVSSIPESVSFEDAIACTQSLLSQKEQSHLTDSEVREAIARLVQTKAGTRGFFVAYLTDERAIADQPDDSILQGLQSGSEWVADILVKNLAMSTATAISHRRQSNQELGSSHAAASERVQKRSRQLLQKLSLPQIPQIAAEMYQSATDETGSYHSFYQRWGYDSEQRQAIQQALHPLVPKQPQT
ncbi:hypothetical protein [Geitlerinema sp. PCC 9228]|jgi:hypothetical protein|uniref:hypothetical protein n=1 Tax=Geitlerinema sp. PCC 9228 TaxID=111611 RepID=UPI0008F9BA46|nr:hypothetical protein [Geitlerinema sp. PCC 9228]